MNNISRIIDNIENAVIVVFIFAVIWICGYGYHQTQPVSNQEQALEEIAVYVDNISKLPPSEVRTEYLTTTKYMLTAGELTRGQLGEIQDSHDRLMTAAGDGEIGKFKSKLINDINEAL